VSPGQRAPLPALTGPLVIGGRHKTRGNLLPPPSPSAAAAAAAAAAATFSVLFRFK